MESKIVACAQKSKREGVKAFMDRMRQQQKCKSANNEEECAMLVDHYKVAQESKQLCRKDTGLIYEDFNLLHKCEWDENYPENPERYIEVMEKFKELGLEKKCQQLLHRDVIVTTDILMTKHSLNHINTLRNICKQNTLRDWEKWATKYDAVYFNSSTFEAAKIAVACAIALVKNVCNGTVLNGMGIIRPPGHHAMQEEYCGYCFFNNVAIAAQYALDNQLAKRILIVDWDVHHGQATQQMFYEDDRVLYFSIHRYQHGKFWPNLRESNFDYIGKGKGLGYNCNVPLNETGFGDTEYMAILMLLLLPMAYEFGPDLIIISAGFDSALGDKKGEMLVTPGCYSHFVHQLMNLAGGRIAVCLEGGYFPDSLSLSAAMTLRSLLGEPLIELKPLGAPKPRCIDTINDVRFALANYWKCFRTMPIHSSLASVPKSTLIRENKHTVKIFYLGQPGRPPYPIKNCYPVKEPVENAAHSKAIKKLAIEYHKLRDSQTVCYTYDERMLKHSHPFGTRAHEQPARISRLYEKFKEFDLEARCKFVLGDEADLDQILLNHSQTYYNYLDQDHKGDLKKFDSVYFNEHSLNCALFSAGSLLAVVQEVIEGNSQSGAALIRPPGHHADHEAAGGYCFFNNVAIAAKFILANYSISRILIVDWDIHHGNGTQNAFYADDRVLYVSIHRYDDAKFYPKSVKASQYYVGDGPAMGKTVNIPFSNGKMGNTEYLRAFQDVVMPIAYSFDPEIVLVSAGFDAGINDPLGGYLVAPEAFAHFTSMLRALANGKVILALEGGYNVETVAYSMVLCIKALLNDPLPPFPPLEPISETALETIRSVIKVQTQYWPMLEAYRQLPDRIRYEGEGVSKEAAPAPECVHIRQLDPAMEERRCSVLCQISNNVKCCKCQATANNCLICLICMQVACDRQNNQHVDDHFEEMGHAIWLRVGDLQVRCLECENDIDGQCLYKYRNLAHVAKFGCSLIECQTKSSSPTSS